MPRFFEQIPGWFDFADIYDQAVAEVSGAARFVEIGVWYGRSLCYLAERIQESGKHIECFAVDPFPLFQQLETCVGHLCTAGVYELVTLFPGTSQQAFETLPGNFDFVFVDGDHQEAVVRQDVNAWWERIRPGGVLAGHDYTGDFPGVRLAVDRFFSTTHAQIEIRGCSWWVRKER
jgi:predicted O-methyltransferase YrrM